MGNKTKSRENNSHNILTAIRAEPALSLYSELLSYYPHIKFLGITSNNRMTFTEHFEEILEHCNQKFHFRTLQPKISSFKNIGQQKVGSKSRNHFTNLQTMCETNIRIWDCFYHNCFGNCHHKNTKSPGLFHWASTSPPKVNVSARLLHDASGLPYVRERLITIGQNHLARMHANPLVEHTINSAKTSIAWDKYKTPISILKPPD